MIDLTVHRFSSKANRCSSLVWLPTDGVIVLVADGFCSYDVVEPFTKLAAVAYDKGGKLQGYYDWNGVTGYAPDVRPRLTDWTKDRPKFDRLILVKSALVAMGINTARIVVKNASKVTAKPQELYDGIRGHLDASDRAHVDAFARRDLAAFSVRHNDV